MGFLVHQHNFVLILDEDEWKQISNNPMKIGRLIKK